VIWQTVAVRKPLQGKENVIVNFDFELCISRKPEIGYIPSTLGSASRESDPTIHDRASA
jgi:hypothetical protein